MLAVRLLSRIEQNWDKIANSVLEQSKRDQNIHHYGRLSDSEVRTRCLDVVHDLRCWANRELSEDAVRAEYRRLGGQRFREPFPLEEVVYMLQTIEWQIVQYVQDENPPQNPVDLYSEVEILRAIDRFFGITVHSVVVGYEAARRLTAATSAVA
jgi:hypothetical protein